MSVPNGLILNPSPGFYNEPISLNIKIDTSLPASERPEFFLVTDNGIPPALAKYICYDSLNPPNPFIATVEDGLGNILLDGGWPKWYNIYVNSGWTTYTQLSATYKYMYDAIDFISNKKKVQAGNKKVLIICDRSNTEVNFALNYNDYGFCASVDKVCSIKGYPHTYMSANQFSGGELNIDYATLDQYCCVIYFASYKLINDFTVKNLIAYREQGNGIFIVTDHMPRNYTSLEDAVANSFEAEYFGGGGNRLITNFGAYFSGIYNRSPVNVGHIRRTYGEHPLWKNLGDNEYIHAGESESEVKVTTYPQYTNRSLTINKEGYNQIKILVKYPDGRTEAQTLIYGYKKEDVIEFKHLGVYTELIEHNVKKQTIEFTPTFPKEYNSTNLLGIIKINGTPIGEFSGIGNNITKKFYHSNATETNFETDKYWEPQDPKTPNIRTLVLSIDVIQPFGYTKNITYKFHKPTKTLRTSKVIRELNTLNLKEENGLRSPQKFLNSNKVDSLIDHIDKFDFKLGRVQSYYGL